MRVLMVEQSESHALDNSHYPGHVVLLLARIMHRRQPSFEGTGNL